MDDLTRRLKFAAGWALRHLLASALVVAVAAALVFSFLYPDPWRSMLGIGTIFTLVVVADVVCGPLLTFVLASPKKSSRERWLDLSLVAIIQLVALAYGLWSVYSARPVMLVFEVDRMVLVTANEVQTEQLDLAPHDLKQLPRFGVGFAGARKATSSQEYLRSLEQSLGGVSPAMRPDWWVSFGDASTQVLDRAKPLTTLLAKRPEQLSELNNAVEKTGVSTGALRYLPLTSSKATDWTALISPAGKVVGYAHVDSFD
jgi:hypothetical protein